MAIGSGLAASLGLSEESTFGTYVAPARWYEFSTESLTKTKNVVQYDGLAGGRYGSLGSRRVVTTSAGSGSWDMQVTTSKMGLLLQHLMGSSAAPTVQGATTAYLLSCPFGDNLGKSLTVQKGVPDTTGTVRPYTFRGAKVISGEFKCGVDESLMMTTEIDAQIGGSEVETLAAPAYSTGISPFHFGQMNVKLGAFDTETAVTGVRGVSVKIERPSKVDRYYANAAGLKAEQLINDQPAITGTIDTDFVTKADFADRFASDSSASLIIEWVGALIASTYNYTFRIKLPMTFFEDATPQVGGSDVVQPSFSFTTLADGTNPIATLEYQSMDTTA